MVAHRKGGVEENRLEIASLTDRDVFHVGEQARRVYYGAVFEAKKEIPVDLIGGGEQPATVITARLTWEDRQLLTFGKGRLQYADLLAKRQC